MKAIDLVRRLAIALLTQTLDRRIGVIAMMFLCACAHARNYTIGFAQSDTAESDWRRANTESFREAAKDLGITLVFKDAGGKTDVQRRQVGELIEQKVDAIVLSANEVHGWDNVLLEAKKARIPVVLSDRTLTLQPENQNKGLFVTWIGSDFRYEGRAAGAWLAQETAGHCNVVEIEGPLDAAPSIERGKGFREVLSLFPGMKIIASKPGMWRADQAKKVMQGFLHDEGANICAVFAHNDNMAFGAIAAIEADKQLALKPGKDILIISVDGVRHGFELLIRRKLNALVECNPLLGKLVLKVVLEVLHGRSFPASMYMEDRVYTTHNAAAALPTRKY
ncbi:ABC transporter substrate-binding protein [Trinickia sp. LjRoot230]|uniref:ABC transporter substrate-binding protein n=1 Tax=Trinickia sp. LjRoot230 TaxID=3342288 RepID=UPI003ED13362